MTTYFLMGITLQRSIYIFALLIAGSLISLMTAFYLVHESTDVEIKKNNKLELSLLHISKVFNDIEQEETYEAKFRLTKNISFIKKYNEQHSLTLQHINTLSASINDTNQKKYLKEIKNYLGAYSKYFKHYITLQTQIGLTEDKGLLGYLRQSIHQVEKVLVLKHKSELGYSMLMMRRHEKDFLARKNNLYVSLFKNQKQHFIELLKTSTLSKVQQRQMQLLINEYETHFLMVVKNIVEMEVAIKQLGLTSEVIGSKLHQLDNLTINIEEKHRKEFDEYLDHISVIFYLIISFLSIILILSIIFMVKKIKKTMALDLQLGILEAATQKLKVGLLLKNEDSYHPVNNMMSQLIDDYDSIQSHLKSGLNNFEDTLVNDKGETVTLNYNSIKLENGSEAFLIQDISESKRYKQHLEKIARYDSLTGLLNRFAFEQHLEMQISESTNDGLDNVLIFMDLDRFKIVNDSCGHAAGDQLLKKLSRIFESQLRKTDILARIGGDEFTVILPQCSLNKATQLAENIIDKLVDFRFVWDQQVFYIGISMGIVLFGKQKTVSDVLSYADIACYSAKQSGGNKYHIYKESDTELKKIKNAMSWVNRIEEGLQNRAFKLFIQPIQHLSINNTKNQHFEILIRYQGKDKEIIPPDHFLPTAERYHLIDKIDQLVVCNTLNWLKEHKSITPQPFFSINLSALSISSIEFQDFLVNILKNTDIDLSYLCFEITETAIMNDIASSVEFINKIKKLGVKFSLDDFGSGLSSFAYLKYLPVDYLKIDGLFIKDILTQPKDLIFVKAIADVGHSLGMEIIAEFVETKEMYPLLKEANIDYIQGYAIGKPKALEQYFGIID